MKAATERAEKRMMQYASLFKTFWERGDAFREAPDDLISSAAMAIVCCQYLQETGGFFTRRGAKKVRSAIEHRMLEAQLSRPVAIKIQELRTAVLNDIQGLSVEEMFPALFSRE